MYFGSNLQHLRKIHGTMTQEKLAEKVGVSRQTVSKWESGEVCPEVSKLMDLCDIFQCNLDELLRQDMTERSEHQPPVRILRVSGFRRAQYVVISRDPRRDANACMEAWAEKNGLSTGKIGWSFPYVSPEQKNRFGLRGYVSACILPDGFEPRTEDVQVIGQEAAEYAVLTLRDPSAAPFHRISQAYHLIFRYLSENGYKKKHSEKILPCFEMVYEHDGMICMDVFVHCDSGGSCNENIDFTEKENTYYGKTAGCLLFP